MDLCCGYDRLYVVINKDEFVYKDNNFNIIKFYNDIKINIKLIKYMDSIWIKFFLYWLMLSGDILI